VAASASAARTAGGLDHLPTAQDRIVSAKGRAQREERDEGYPACVALLEHGHRGAVNYVQLILDTDDVGLPDRVQQVLASDAAEADAPIKPSSRAFTVTAS
jgi:hypothetical protein